MLSERMDALDSGNWDTNPQVQSLRLIFAKIEAGQEEFLERLGLSPYDHRLRRWREETLILFEKVWVLSAKQGLPLDEKETVQGYLHCLVNLLGRSGVDIPIGLLPSNEKINGLVREVIG